jgi:hypothetical protein
LVVGVRVGRGRYCTIRPIRRTFGLPILPDIFAEFENLLTPNALVQVQRCPEV